MTGAATANTPRQGDRAAHVVVVDAYDGFLEHLTDEATEREASSGLGLPLAEIAAALECRLTLLDWSDWHRSEARYDSYARWMPFPAARPLDILPLPDGDPFAGDPRITRRPIPAIDPDFRHPFHLGLSPRTFGLLAESDPLFLASCLLDDCLTALHRTDPVDAVILPMFGGPGYVALMARATGAGLTGVPFAVVVTGTSEDRQAANGEGHWTRPAVTRRQMEDLSLGLADLTLCFGPRAQGRVRRDRPEVPCVQAPRRVPNDVLEAIDRARDIATDTAQPIRFFLQEPQQGASGVLVLLDAVHALRRAGDRLSLPVTCSGTAMYFPPNLPRDFQGYWSGRGWVRDLVEAGFWRWAPAPPETGDGYPVRLYPSLFEHLPDIWTALGHGQAVLLSPEAAEGLAPGAVLPAAMLLPDPPTAATLADRLRQIEASGAAQLDSDRRALCDAVLMAHRGPERQARQEATIAALADLIAGRLVPARLDAAVGRLLDGRIGVPLVLPPAISPPAGNPTLAVAVACYEMGDLVVETVESIWQSSRVPDELLLVDDGSQGDPTRLAIARLEAAAASRNLPLTVIRQRNLGLASARNRALSETTATYISFLDGDDLIGADFYRLALGVLVNNPGLGGVAAWSETFGEGVAPGFWNPPQPQLPALLAENSVFVPCLSPVALLRDLGGYDTRQRYNYEDWELAIRLLEAGRPIVTIPRYLQRYRVRADSLLRTMSDVQNQVMREEMFRNHRATIERFGPELSAMIEHRLMRTLGRTSGDGTSLSAKAALGVLRDRGRDFLDRSLRRAAWHAQRLMKGKAE